MCDYRIVTVGSKNGVDRKMDKSKSRTDLLAAGKKKLQQYRQKRENKGDKGGSSRGKSSKKSSKNQLSESDADSASVTSTGSSQVTDGNFETNSDPNLESQSLASPANAENVNPSNDSSSVAMTYDTDEKTDLDSTTKLALQGGGVHEKDSESSAQDRGGSSQNVDANVAKDVSLTSSPAPDNVDPSFDSSSVAVTYDTGHETELDSNAKLELKGQAVYENDSELSSQDQGGSCHNVSSDVHKDVSLNTSNREGGTTQDHASEPVALMAPYASITTALGESVIDEKESEKREKSSPLSEDIPNTSVVQTGEDQGQCRKLMIWV